MRSRSERAHCQIMTSYSELTPVPSGFRPGATGGGRSTEVKGRALSVLARSWAPDTTNPPFAVVTDPAAGAAALIPASTALQLTAAIAVRPCRARVSLKPGEFWHVFGTAS
jgi:hypothetical protein